MTIESGRVNDVLGETVNDVGGILILVNGDSDDPAEEYRPAWP